MSFLDAIKKLVTGQPVFTTKSDGQYDQDLAQPVQQEQTEAAVEPAFGTPRDQRGEKILPVVAVKRVDCRLRDAGMECWGVLQNQAPYKMELDKISLLGVRLELDNFLEPNEEREYLLYSGARPTSEADHNCQLQYLNESGDYFSAEHYVHLAVQPDGTYVINRLEFVPPVRDI